MGAYELIVEKIKSKDNSKKILSRINALFKSFSYLNISEEKLYNIVLEEIDKANNAVEKADSYDKYLLSMINNRLINISRELLSDLDSSFKIIDNYINKNIKNVKNISDSILYFDKINEIFDSCGLIPSLELIQYLISNNNTFSRMISLIVKHYKSKIVNEEIDEVFDNDTILTSIDVYCDVVDKSIKQEEMVKETRKVSSKSSLNEYPATRKMNERPVLKQSEELDVAKKIAEGDEEARELLIESNLRLVSKYAFKYSYSKVPVEDLFQEGLIGLMTAVDKFDYTRGFKFSTFATYWIRQAIKRFIDDNARTIRLPVYLSEKIYKFNKDYNKLELELGRPATIDELSKKTRLSRKKVEELITIQNDAFSLDTPVGEDGEEDLYTFIPDSGEDPHNIVINGTLKDELIKLIDISKLTFQNKEVVKYYFGLMDGVPHSFEETGKKFNKSKQMIDQIVKKSIRVLRNSSAVFEMTNYFEDEERAKNNIIALRAGKSISNKKTLPNLSIYQLIKGNRTKIDETIANLSEESRAVIEKRYGSDLENPDFYELSPEEIDIFNDAIKTIKSSYYNSKKVSTINKKTIYQKISNYSKEQVDIVLGTFLDKELDVLKKRYGKDFEHPEYRQLLPDELSEFTSLFVRIKKRLQYLYGTDKSSLGLNLYQQFSNNTREDVDYVVLSFSEDKVQLLKKMYGDNLEEVRFKNLTSEEGKIIFDEIYPVLTRKLTIIYKNRLKGINFTTSSKSKTIYEIIGDDFTEEEVDALIEKLKEAGEDLSLVYKRYGGDLKNPIFTSLSSKEYANSYNKILRIKKILNGEMSISVKENKKEIKKNTKSNKIENNTKSNKIKNNTKSNKIKNNTNGNIIKKNSESNKSKNSARGNSLYDLVGKNGETKEQIDEAIEKLKGFGEEVSILYVRYGPNLDKPVKVLTEDENRTFQNIISKLRRIIANPNMNISKHIFFENNTLFEAMEHSEYSKEQVLSGINKLNDGEINVLKRIFGNDFENICTTAHFTEGEKKVLSKLKNEIKKSKRGVLNKSHFSGETIYESMKKLGYNKIQVDGAIKKLADGGVDVSILYKRFGPTLNEIVSQLDDDETIALQKIKQRIKKHIANPNIPIIVRKTVKNKNLYQIMKEEGYTKKKVDTVISNLIDEEKMLLKKFFGENFDQVLITKSTFEESKSRTLVLKKMRRELKKITKNSCYKNIYQLLSDFSEKQVDEVISIFKNEGRDIQIIYDRYGDNLKKPKFVKLKSNQWSEFYKVVGKLERRLNKIYSCDDNSKTIYQFIKGDYSEEDVDGVIDLLCLEGYDITILFDRYGPDLKNPSYNKLLTSQHSAFKKVVAKIQRRLDSSNYSIFHQRNGQTIYDLIKGDYTVEEVDEVIDLLGYEGQNIQIIYDRYGNDLKKTIIHPFSKEQFSELNNIIGKIRRRLKSLDSGILKRQTLAELIKGDYSEKQIHDVIDQLGKEGNNVNLLFGYYGDDLKKSRITLSRKANSAFYVIIDSIESRLKELNNKPVLIGDTLYESMEKHGYNKQQVDDAVKKLADGGVDVSILYKRFGPTLNEIVSKLDDDESKALQILKSRIQRHIANPNVQILERKTTKNKNLYQIMEEYGYTKEKVDIVLSNLIDEEKMLLNKFFGDNFDQVLTPKTTIEEGKSRTLILKKMRRELQKISKDSHYNKTIYQLIKGDFSIEEKDRMIEQLRSEGEDFSIFDKRFGGNLKNPKFNSLTEAESRKLYVKAHKISRRLARVNMKRKKSRVYGKSLYELMKKYDFTKEQVDKSILTLEDERKEILYKRFDKDTLVPINKLDVDDRVKLNSVLGMIRARIRNPEKFKDGKPIRQIRIPGVKLKGKTIYEIMAGYGFEKEEDVDAAIGKLDPNGEYIQILNKRYFGDLKNPTLFKSLNKEDKRIFKNAQNNILKLLQNPDYIGRANYNKSLYEIFSKYQKQQVDDIIITLTNEDINKLKHFYGEDFLEPHTSDLSEKDLETRRNIIKKMKKRLLLKESGKTIVSKNNNIYQVMSQYGFSREEVILELNSLDKDQMDFLHKRYGDDFDNPIFTMFSDDEHVNLNNILRFIKRNIERARKSGPVTKSIYQILDKYPEEKIDKAITKLREEGEDLSIFDKVYGKDLKNLEFESKSISGKDILIFEGKINKVKKYIKNQNKKIVKRVSSYNKNLYEYMNEYGYTKDKVDKVISKLNENDINILKVIYGEDFNSPCTIKIGKEEHRVLSKIKRVVKNPETKNSEISKNSNVKRRQTFYEKMKKHGYSSEEVILELNSLDKEQMDLLQKRYGEDLDNLESSILSDDEKSKFSNLLREIKRNIERARKSGPVTKSIYQILDKYPEDKIDEAITRLREEGEDLSIFDKVYGKDLKNLEFLSKSISGKDILIFEGKISNLKKYIKNHNKKGSKRVSLYNKNLYEYMTEYGYTKDKVDKVISKLSEKNITVLKEIYGEDFNSPCTIKIGKKEYRVLSKIRRVIENPETPNAELPKKRVGRKRETFYELMVNQRYSRDQINGVVATLSMEEINKLKGFYGDNFDEICSDDLTKEENATRINIINRIRKRLENPELQKGRRRKKKDSVDVSTREESVSGKDTNSLMQLSKDFSKEQMIDAINSLPDKYKDVFKKRFGNDFSNVKGLNPEDYDVYLEALEGLKKILSKPKRLTIYQLFKEYPKDRVNQVIDSLSDEEKELLYRKYGKKLKKPVFKELSQEDSDDFYGSLLPKMRKELEKKSKSLTKKTIYQLAGKYEKNLVNYVISSLNDDEKKILVLRYGYNLIEPIYRELNDDSKDEFTKVLAKVRRQLVIASKEKNLYQIMDGYSKEEVNKVIPSVLSNDDINMLKKKFGKNYDNPYSQILTEIEKKHLTGVILKRIKTELDNPGSLSQKKLVKTKKTVSSSLKSPRNRETLFNSIVKLHDSFSYVNISQEEFDDIVLSSIEDSTKEYNGTVEYNKFLLGIIKDRLNDKVNALVNNTESSYDVINNYIKNTCENIKTAKKALQEFNRISSFFDLYDYSPDEEVISKLIDDNDVFSKMISLIVRGYRQEVLSGNTDSLTDNPSLLSRVCEYVGIDQVDYIEEKTTSNFSNLSLLDRAINEYPVLNADDEYKITKRIAEGDSEARDTFFLSNIRLVKSIAATIHTNFFSFDDLVQEGFLGLMAAIDKFDYTRGYKFSTYASWWIRQSITRAVADKDNTVRLPVHKGDELNRFNRVRSNLIQVLGREPTDIDIANEMKIPLEKVWEMIELPSPMLSFDAPVSSDDDSETTLSNFVSDNKKSPSETFMDNSFSEEFDKFIHSIDLKDREIDIVRGYFDFDGKGPKTLEKVGEEFHITRERVRQILVKVEKRMVKSPKFEALLEYSEFADVYKERLAQLREHLYKTNSLVMDKPKKKEKVKKNSNRGKNT